MSRQNPQIESGFCSLNTDSWQVSLTLADWHVEWTFRFFQGHPMSNSYNELKERIQELQNTGKLPTKPTDEQRVDWAYGNTAIDCQGVTRDMAERVVADKYGK